MKQDSGERRPPDGEAAIQPAVFRPPSTAPDLARFRLPWAKLGVAAVLAVSMWATWFILTARSVVITTEPAESSISVEERIAPYINGHWLLRPGPHRLRIEATGYIPYRGDLVITAQPLQSHTVRLNPLPGHLRVSVPLVGKADIFIDGSLAGTAPTTVRDIEAGNHELTIAADRYIPYEAVLEIQGRGIEQALEIELKPAWADVTISSQPDAADVLVDKKLAGKSPVTIEILQGTHEIHIERQGYKTWRREMHFTAGKTVNLPEIILAKADGRLVLETRPSGANVTIDGDFKGRSPVEQALTPDTPHEVSIYTDGYISAKRSVTVGSGQTEKLELELEPELATIRLATTPEDAELLIDGKPHGSATQTLSLPTRDHEIIVRKKGYATYSKVITPRKGVEKRYKIRLKTAAEMARESAAGAGISASTDGVIETSAGQQLKLFKGGQVTLGTSRREAGRRANEVMQKVTLARPFYLALKEVSNAEFRLFLAHHTIPAEKGNELNDDEQPVVNVTWEAAATYCNWLSRRDSLPVFYQIKYGKVLGVNPDATGYRLPTEAEWAWAARVPPKGEPFKFPWGENYPPRGKSGNYADQSAARIVADVIPNYNDGYAVSAPVGSFAPNLRGLYDMGGNVAEWVHDYYDIPTTDDGVLLDPLGPSKGENHVIRGSSWAHASITELRLAFRDYGTAPRSDLGFRLARYAQ